MLFDAIKLYMTSGSRQSHVRSNREMETETGPLVTIGVYAYADTTHIQRLGTELLMPISVPLLIWSDRFKRTTGQFASSREAFSESVRCVLCENRTDSTPV